jgi:CDP-diacylglycerol--serine O-phosphatidyltransferase
VNWRERRAERKSQRKKKSRSGRRRVIRDRARRGLALLPSLLTLANLVCGFFAIVHVGAVTWKDGAPLPVDSFQVAAMAIMLAMVFDMLDGRVARMTNSTSEFGAQLDSLADAVTFGVAPGVMVAMLHAMGRFEGLEPFWSRMAWVFGAAYACAAVIRLARFNVSTDSHEESAHLDFTGLPSPAAAGVIATLVLLHSFLLSDRADTRLAWIEPNLVELSAQRLLDLLPFVALACGYLMVSKFRYAHVANKFLKGRKPVDYLSGAIFLAVLVALFPEVCAAVTFCGFALTGPVLGFRAWMLGTSSEDPAGIDGDDFEISGEDEISGEHESSGSDDTESDLHAIPVADPPQAIDAAPASKTDAPPELDTELPQAHA